MDPSRAETPLLPPARAACPPRPGGGYASQLRVPSSTPWGAGSIKVPRWELQTQGTAEHPRVSRTSQGEGLMSQREAQRGCCPERSPRRTHGDLGLNPTTCLSVKAQLYHKPPGLSCVNADENPNQLAPGARPAPEHTARPTRGRTAATPPTGSSRQAASFTKDADDLSSSQPENTPGRTQVTVRPAPQVGRAGNLTLQPSPESESGPLAGFLASVTKRSGPRSRKFPRVCTYVVCRQVPEAVVGAR